MVEGTNALQNCAEACNVKEKSEWDGDREKAFLTNFASLVETTNHDVTIENALNGCTAALHQLFHDCVSGKLNTEDVLTLVDKFIHWSPDIPSTIVDILVALDTEFSVDVELRPQFVVLCKGLASRLPVKLFKERYELDSIAELELFPAKSFSSKCIKLKTKLYFKQNKFNLLREEIEGFSKLVVTVHNQSCLPDLSVSIPASENILCSYCGLFNLDPARVLDLVFDIFEFNMENQKYFTTLINGFIKEQGVIMEVLTFRYQMHFTDGSTPPSLHQLTVALINEKIIKFDEIYQQLEPSDEETQREIEQRLEAAQKKGVKIAEEKVEPFEFHQKAGLIEAAVAVGRWDLLEAAASGRFREFFLHQKPIAEAACRLIHFLLEPLYAKHGPSYMARMHRQPNQYSMPSSSIAPVKTWDEMLQRVEPLLVALGPSMHLDPSLLCKLSYLCGNFLDNPNVDVKTDVLRILENGLLPALSLCEAALPVSEILWENVLKKFDVAVRYCCYSNWREMGDKCPALMRKRQVTLQAIRTIMKKLSKENVKPMGRALCKLAHSAPVELAEAAVAQAQLHESLAGPLTEALKYLGGLGHDALGFALLEALKSPRASHDGTAPMPWFTSASSFAGALLRKHPVDPGALLRLLAERLFANDYVFASLLRELLLRLAGVDSSDDLTDDQLAALGGGPILRSEAAGFAPARAARRSAARLRSALLEDSLLGATAVLLAQARASLLTEPCPDLHLKFMGRLFDECHSALLQFGAFASAPEGATAVGEAIPSFSALVKDYGLSRETALFLARPHLIHSALRAPPTEESNATSDSATSSATAMTVDGSTPSSLSREERLFEDEEESPGTGWGTEEGSFEIPAEAVESTATGAEWDADDEATWRAHNSTAQDRPIALQVPTDCPEDADDDEDLQPDDAFLADDSFLVDDTSSNTSPATPAAQPIVDPPPTPSSYKNKDDTGDDYGEDETATGVEMAEALIGRVLPEVLSVLDATGPTFDPGTAKVCAAFWTLSLHDISVPTSLYEKEISRLNAAANADPSKSSRKDAEKTAVLAEKMAAERLAQEAHVAKVKEHLAAVAPSWFSASAPRSAKNDLINAVLHVCVLPRVLLSAPDAIYSAKFLLLLHELRLEHFSTVLCYDRLLCDIKNLVAQCSENEATRLGRFLCAVLEDLRWFHSSKEIYEKECANTPGFITKFRSAPVQTDSDKVDYENFRHLCHKWHYKLTKALICLLDSPEYILRRNTIIVLKKILPHFPVLVKLAQCIERKIDKVKTDEKGKRQDLHILAASYWGQLVGRTSLMIKEKEFHQIAEEEGGGDENGEADQKSSGKNGKDDSSSDRMKADSKKTRKKHKSRSASAEPHDKRSKDSRGSPDAKRTRKKEKKTSKRKPEDSPSAEKKHKSKRI